MFEMAGTKAESLQMDKTSFAMSKKIKGINAFDSVEFGRSLCDLMDVFDEIGFDESWED